MTDFDVNPFALLEALRFQHDHPSLRLWVEDEMFLHAAPAEVAREHAADIQRLKPELVRLLSTRPSMRPYLMDQLVGQSMRCVGQMLAGVAVEVIEHLQIERPDEWSVIQGYYDAMHQAMRVGDYDAFAAAIVAHMRAYERGKRIWLRARAAEKKATAA